MPRLTVEALRYRCMQSFPSGCLGHPITILLLHCLCAVKIPILNIFGFSRLLDFMEPCCVLWFMLFDYCFPSVIVHLCAPHTGFFRTCGCRGLESLATCLHVHIDAFGHHSQSAALMSPTPPLPPSALPLSALHSCTSLLFVMACS